MPPLLHSTQPAPQPAARPSRYAEAEASHLARTLERAICEADRTVLLCERGAGPPDAAGARAFRAWAERLLALRNEIAFTIGGRP